MTTTAFSARTRAAIAAQAKRAAAPPESFADWADRRGVYLWSMQLRAGQLVQEHKRTAVRSGAGIGKSYVAAAIICWWVDTHPVNDVYVWTTAPGGDQVSGVMWEELRKLHTRLGLPGHIGLDNKWRIGGILVAQGRKPADKAEGSEDDPDTGQGFHREFLLVVLDDAGGLDEWLWDSAENVTTGDGCRIFATGNPDHAGSRFAAVCTGAPGWAALKLSAFDSPRFTGEAASVPAAVLRKLTGPQWVADRAKDWGTDDRRYISKVLGEFPSDHPDQIISAADVTACQFPDVRAAAQLEPVELGVDVGGGGDLTTIRERRGVKAGRRWARLTPNPEEVAPLVLHAIKETGATSVKIDGIGIGWGLAGDLRRARERGEHQAAVHVVMVSQASSEPDKYFNLRSELWWVVGREACQRREWDLSAMEESSKTIAELLSPRWRPDPKGRIKVEPKDDIRARTGGRSPDDADALLLAFYVPRDGQSAYFEALTSGRLSR